MSLVDIVKYILFLVFAIFVPGFAIISRSTLKKTSLTFFLSITLGIVIFTLTSVLGGIFGFRYLQLATTPLFLLTLFLGRKTLRQFNFQEIWKSKIVFLTILVILFGTIFQNLIPFNSGRNYDFGIGYWGPLAHDGVWHESLSGELINNFPPNNPTFSGTKLTNYHYFYNLLIADTSRFTGISIRDLIYRFYSILFSILLGIGAYLLSVRIFKNRSSAIFSLLFVYFGSSLGWIVEWFKQKTVGGESTFWANQPVSMNINPPFAISLILFISSIYLFFLLEKRDKFLYLAFVAISGTLIGFKVYAGVILLPALVFIAIVQVFTKRDLFYIKTLMPIFIISAVIFFSQTDSGGSLIEFKPLWLVDSMIDFTDRVGWVKLSSARNTFLSSGNWVKYLAAEIVSLSIFIIGNLGTRIVGIISIFYILKRKLLNLNEFVFLFGLNLVSILLPLAFVQKGNPWNTIQFFYYFMFFASILAGFALYRLLFKLPKFAGVSIFIIFFIATSLSSFSTFKSGFQGAPARITKAEVSSLEFLKSEPNGVVLTPPFDISLRKHFISPFPISVYETSAYVSANTRKEVFVEDEFQQEIFQNKDYKKRLADSKSFFSSKDNLWSKEFLVKNKIRYIYLPKVYNYILDEKSLNIAKIYENSEIIIYSR